MSSKFGLFLSQMQFPYVYHKYCADAGVHRILKANAEKFALPGTTVSQCAR